MRNARTKATSKRRVRDRHTGTSYPALVSVDKNAILEASSLDYDSETASWISRCLSAGGTLTTDQEKAADAFVRAIKNQSGLRQKIKRLNVFVGDFTSSLIPLFNDSGHSSDQNNSFTNSFCEDIGETIIPILNNINNDISS